MTAKITIVLDVAYHEDVEDILKQITHNISHGLAENAGVIGDSTYHFTSDGDLEEKSNERYDYSEGKDHQQREKKAALHFLCQDAHSQDCTCGGCSPTNGLAFDVGIYDITHLVEEHDEETITFMIRNELEPEGICTAPNVGQAFAKARIWAEEHGYEVVLE